MVMPVSVRQDWSPSINKTSFQLLNLSDVMAVDYTDEGADIRTVDSGLNEFHEILQCIDSFGFVWTCVRPLSNTGEQELLWP
jgi:hypothetical protein